GGRERQGDRRPVGCRGLRGEHQRRRRGRCGGRGERRRGGWRPRQPHFRRPCSRRPPAPWALRRARSQRPRWPRRPA
ncbi:unnamed protein product, partial [Prorocentrum cordatum]